jgi:hypothetical protein
MLRKSLFSKLFAIAVWHVSNLIEDRLGISEKSFFELSITPYFDDEYGEHSQNPPIIILKIHSNASLD